MMTVTQKFTTERPNSQTSACMNMNMKWKRCVVLKPLEAGSQGISVSVAREASLLCFVLCVH